MGGKLSVVFAGGRIEVAWDPAAPEAPAMASIGPLLLQRRFDEARPLLETLLQLQPEHPEALYNLGVLASEEGKPEEARLLLRRAVVANAGDAHAQANAQVALALAAMRLGDKAEARQALEAAIELEPQNSFALRSLGSLLVIAGAFAAGVARFRQALQVAPDDLITTYNLAQALLELDPDEHRDEADRLLLQVIEAQPYGELANKAKDLRGGIAARDLRTAQPEGLRQDAVSYCLQALQLFEGMDQQRFIAVLSEVVSGDSENWSGGDTKTGPPRGANQAGRQGPRRDAISGTDGSGDGCADPSGRGGDAAACSSWLGPASHC
jgi:Flp pilus assembly protein TadD